MTQLDEQEIDRIMSDDLAHKPFLQDLFGFRIKCENNQKSLLSSQKQKTSSI